MHTIFISVLAILLLSAIGAQRSASTLQCDSSEVLYLNKCFCKPGYERDKQGSAICSVPLLRNGDCECDPENKNRDEILLDPKWTHKSGYRCTALCRYTSELGVITSIASEWNENQKWRQLSFYRKELTHTSLGHKATHMRHRLEEFGDGFERFATLNNTDLGDVIEFGAGGYTQIRNILEMSSADMKSVTLVDPQIYDYKEIPASSYFSGKLEVPFRKPYETTLSNLTVEAFGKQLKGRQYDTVVMMNVLVYARNALDFLTTLHASLKVGGTLIFHDRWFQDSVVSSNCRTAGFAMHIIQVRKNVLEHLLSHFENTPFLSEKQTKGQLDRSKNWCKWKDDEMGFWAIVKKRK